MRLPARVRGPRIGELVEVGEQASVDVQVINDTLAPAGRIPAKAEIASWIENASRE